MRTPTSIIKARRQAGFTLAEMLAVLFILSIAAVIVGPRLSLSTDRWDLRRDGQELTAMLRATRLLAMNAGEAQSVTFNPDAKSIRTEKTTLSLPDTAIQTITAQEMDSEDGLPQIVYFPDGTASGGRVTLSRDGFQYAVGIDWLTGAAESQMAEAP